MGIGFLCSWYISRKWVCCRYFLKTCDFHRILKKNHFVWLCIVFFKDYQDWNRVSILKKIHNRNGDVNPGQETIRWQWNTNLISAYSCEKGEKRQERWCAGALWRGRELSWTLWGSFSLLDSGSSASSDFLILNLFIRKAGQHHLCSLTWNNFAAHRWLITLSVEEC